MNIIYDDATLALFLAGTTNPTLRSLVEQLFAKAARKGLSDYTCMSVFMQDDPLTELAALLGDDPRQIAWTWRTERGPFIELGLTLGNEGFAHIVIAERGGKLET